MVYRQYKSTDRKACIEIFSSNVPRFFDTEELTDFETWLNGQDAGRLAYKQTKEEHYYVAEQDNKIIACGGFYIPRDETRANMVWGMVDNSLHKQGIGRKFLEYRINLIKKLFPDYIISLDTTQYSYKFFEKLGFKLTKVTKDYYAKDLDRYDMINQ